MRRYRLLIAVTAFALSVAAIFWYSVSREKESINTTCPGYLKSIPSKSVIDGPNGMQMIIERHGDPICPWPADSYHFFVETVRFIKNGREVSTLDTSVIDGRLPVYLDSINFSPDGSHVYFELGKRGGEESHLADTSTGRDVLRDLLAPDVCHFKVLWPNAAIAIIIDTYWGCDDSWIRQNLYYWEPQHPQNLALIPFPNDGKAIETDSFSVTGNGRYVEFYRRSEVSAPELYRFDTHTKTVQ